MRSMIGEVESIIGGLNCCSGTKKRRLEEFIEKHNPDNIGTTQHTRMGTTQMSYRSGLNKGWRQPMEHRRGMRIHT